ncbi:hypothetical protein [Streptomyces sp.]|nr:hypothetical protein [Streptomyces sp.]HZF92320.1 hypothetical protein [Streptomyces sp.]
MELCDAVAAVDSEAPARLSELRVALSESEARIGHRTVTGDQVA